MASPIPYTVIEDILLRGPRATAAEITAHGVGPEHFASLYDTPAGTRLSKEELWQTLEKPPLLMHAADFFGIAPSPYENEFTQRALKNLQNIDPEDLARLAKLEHRALVAAYRFFGMPVTVMLPQPGARDGVFSTDSDKSFRAALELPTGEWELQRILALTPNFMHRERQPEAAWKTRMLETTLQNPNPEAHRQIIAMQNIMEFGDTRIIFHEVHPGKKDGGFILAGIAETTASAVGRSTPEGHREFKRYLQQWVHPKVEVHTVELIHPFYHEDTTGVDGANGEFFTHPVAYRPNGWGVMKALFGDKLVTVPEEDLFRFLGNGTGYGKYIFATDDLSETTRQLVTERGYDLILVPITATRAGGGGHRCDTSVSPEIFIEGGYHFDHLDFSRQGRVFQVVVNRRDDTIRLHEVRGGKLSPDGLDISGFALDFVPWAPPPAYTLGPAR